MLFARLIVFYSGSKSDYNTKPVDLTTLDVLNQCIKILGHNLEAQKAILDVTILVYAISICYKSVIQSVITYHLVVIYQQ